MSKPDTNVTVHSVPETDENQVVEKQSTARKVGTWIKNHKKTTITVAVLGLLVGGAALAGNDSNSTPELEVTLGEPEPLELESTDNTVA